MLETDFWYAMIARAPRLNYLRYPRVECKLKVPGVNVPKKFECFMELTRTQREFFVESTESWLLRIDFKNVDSVEDINYENFEILRLVDSIKGKKLLNLHSQYLGLGSPAIAFDEFNCITSILDYDSEVSRAPIKNLKRILIRSMSSIAFDWVVPQSEWENLRSIRIHFDSGFVMAHLLNHDEREQDEELDDDFLFLQEYPDRTW